MQEELPPMIIKVHGGPTASADVDLIPKFNIIRAEVLLIWKSIIVVVLVLDVSIEALKGTGE